MLNTMDDQYTVPAVPANPFMPNGYQQPAPVAATPQTPVPTNPPPKPQPLPVAVEALDKGLRYFAKSATTIADYACNHPDEIETAIERVGAIYKQLGDLQTSASSSAESSKKLEGAVDEASKTAEWFRSQVTNGGSNQPFAVNYSGVCAVLSAFNW